MICPKCKFVEPLCWHYPTYHGLEMPYAKMQELELECPELAAAIKKGEVLRPGILESTDICYAYKYHLKTGYVRRRELSIWKCIKWSNIPMEKRQRHIPGKQKKLEVS
jgi:hypothetical protein